MIETAAGEEFIYDGMFIDGKFDGYGRLIQTDFSKGVRIVEGNFKDGKQHVPSIFVFGPLKAAQAVGVESVNETGNYFRDTSKYEDTKN